MDFDLGNNGSMRSPLLSFSLILIILFTQTDFANAEGKSAKFKNLESQMVEDILFQYSKDSAETLINDYPPSQYTVVGLGRTTGVTGEFARQLTNNEAYFYDAPVENLKDLKKMNEVHSDEVWKKVFPPPEKLAGKKLVVHRFLWSGHTMADTMESMVKYLVKNKYPTPVHFNFDHTTDPSYLPFDSEVMKNSVIRNHIKINFHEVEEPVYNRFIKDLDYFDGRSRGKVTYTDIGRLDPAKADGLAEKAEFKKNKTYPQLQRAVQNELCMELFMGL